MFCPSVPRDLEKLAVGGNGSASVPLKWQRPQSGTPAFYRVEVATSPFFVADGKVIERDQLASLEFTASDLAAGSLLLASACDCHDGTDQ